MPLSLLAWPDKVNEPDSQMVAFGPAMASGSLNIERFRQSITSEQSDNPTAVKQSSTKPDSISKPPGV